MNDLSQQVQEMRKHTQQQEDMINNLSTLVRKSEHIAYVQNAHTLAIHGLRSGDATTTMCGWKLGPAKLKRGLVRYLSTIQSEPWEVLCERCLHPERVAAKAFASANSENLELSD